ncbi:hypothetical protein BDZ94DRAFT_1275546, partial [Collybia nuda]
VGTCPSYTKVVHKLPNSSTLINIALHQTTLLACVTIPLYKLLILSLSELIMTTAWSAPSCSYREPGHPIHDQLANYQATSRTPMTSVSASRRSLGNNCISVSHTQIKKEEGVWPPISRRPCMEHLLGRMPVYRPV